MGYQYISLVLVGQVLRNPFSLFRKSYTTMAAAARYLLMLVVMTTMLSLTSASWCAFITSLNSGLLACQETKPTENQFWCHISIPLQYYICENEVIVTTAAPPPVTTGVPAGLLSSF